MYIWKEISHLRNYAISWSHRWMTMMDLSVILVPTKRLLPLAVVPWPQQNLKLNIVCPQSMMKMMKKVTWDGGWQSQLVWCTVTSMSHITPAKFEWPSQNSPPTFAACGICRFRVKYISLNNVLQVSIYLYTTQIVLCGQKGPTSLPKWASKHRMNRTLWESIFTPTFADTKCITYKYLHFLLNKIFLWTIFPKISWKICDFTILGNPEKKFDQ